VDAITVVPHATNRCVHPVDPGRARGGGQPGVEGEAGNDIPDGWGSVGHLDTRRSTQAQPVHRREAVYRIAGAEFGELGDRVGAEGVATGFVAWEGGPVDQRHPRVRRHAAGGQRGRGARRTGPDNHQVVRHATSLTSRP
jgi:hypothetical protein